jgi:hypothetical protein
METSKVRALKFATIDNVVIQSAAKDPAVAAPTNDEVEKIRRVRDGQQFGGLRRAEALRMTIPDN